MGNIVEAIHPADQAPQLEGSLPVQVQKALSEILKSVPFRASKQSQHLLKYLVDQALHGRVERLKERIIGAEVFGRAIDYDTNEDPIVRSRAAEVRKRLAQYYVGEGKAARIQIEIIPGSYVPNFVEINKAPANELRAIEHGNPPAQVFEEAVPSALPSSTLKASALVGRWVHLKFRWIMVIAVLALSAVGLASYSLRPKNAVQLFWSPFLDSAKPVLIYTGANPVYMPSSQLIERFKATHHVDDLDAGGHEFLVPVAENEKLGAADLVSIQNEFVTIGDMSANVGVASLLTRYKHPFDLRSGEDVVFGDLHESPAVLVGAFNNAWTLQMTGDLPFVFGSGLSIRDQANSAREWHPVISSENKIQVDYAMVARLPHSKTGSALITIAGITQCGTRAAAEFITSQQGLSELMHTMPNDWMKKNLELVLKTRVVNDIPTTPTVVAVRSW